MAHKRNTDKMCVDILTGDTPNTPQFIRPIYQNRPIIWDMFEKSPYHTSIVHVTSDATSFTLAQS